MKTPHWLPSLIALLIAAPSAVCAAAGAAPDAYVPVPGAMPEPIPESAGVIDKADLEAFVDGIMAAHLRQNELAGATFAIVKDGEPLLIKGYGYADVEQGTPVDGDRTLFRPGSTSKLFTWTAVMQLVEQGRLDLDADVNTYLTAFKLPDTYPQPVTLRNLLTHTAGFEDGGLGYLIVDDVNRLVPLADSLARRMPVRVRPPAMDFNDGTGSSYSNWGTALAGLIVADVSGLSFDEYIEENIFKPLAMTSSTFREPLPPELAERMSNGYVFKNGKLVAHEFEFIHNFGPAGSLTSSASDMANFMIAHLQKGRLGDQRILREETAELMHGRAMSPNPHINGAGLGFYETYVNGRRIIGHGGDTLYFHTDMSLLPDENVGIFVSYNSSNKQGPGIARRDLVRAILDRYYPAQLPTLTPPEDFSERGKHYAGNYRLIRHSYTKFEKFFGLLSTIKVSPTKDNTLIVAGLGADPSHWIEIAPSVFRRIDNDQTIAFAEDSDGNVTHLLGVPLTFIPAYKLAWHQASTLHFLILGFGALCFFAAIVSALRNWKVDRVGPPKARLARWLAAGLGLTFLVFLVLLVVTFTGDIGGLIFRLPTILYVALVLPLLAIPLTLAVVYFAGIGWKEKYWGRYGRIQYTLVAVMSLAYLWSLNFWNLLGYRIG